MRERCRLAVRGFWKNAKPVAIGEKRAIARNQDPFLFTGLSLSVVLFPLRSYTFTPAGESFFLLFSFQLRRPVYSPPSNYPIVTVSCPSATLRTMASDQEAANALKLQGNKAFAEHEWPTAVDYYTKAIEKYDKEPSFFCNRAQVRRPPTTAVTSWTDRLCTLESKIC